jgi:nephrocystin-3
MKTEDRQQGPISERVVRVFVSSTFLDMQAERDELAKWIFPQLRKLCEQRAVTWTEVDLRWGITDEQQAEGKVLPICLEEIKRCRPFFIGLLGERYGWIPDQIPDALKQREPWLIEHEYKSVTELEILHGVLRNPAMDNRAYFYFRDPAYIRQIPAERRADFCESDPARRRKLDSLKKRIRACGAPVQECYPNPKTLGQMVLADLTVAINQMFPPEKVPDALDREAAEHDTFARSRAGVYIRRKEHFRRLDRHAAEGSPPLVVQGESGWGKSALLANWALRYHKRHPEDCLITHFVGASTRSADWAMMVRRIMGELKRHFKIRQDVPDRPEDLRPAFANWLHMVAAKDRIVLVLDGLNQLEDRDQALDLVWLPEVLPAEIRLIVSTLPGRPLDELKRRGWSNDDLCVGPLEPEERKRLIRRYLRRYGKGLEPGQTGEIAAKDPCANPLYLRALLEELRLQGDQPQLEKNMKDYLAAPTVPELYVKILDRYERDYDRERPGLVKEAMSLIWASRRGLSEVELLEMLGKDDSPLPHAYWSPLHLAAESSLVNRSGLIGFSHAYLREAVRRRYLPTQRIEGAVHRRLAAYFDKQEITSRKADEMPWQFAQSEDWQRLYDSLADPEFVDFCWKANPFEVKRHWTLVETRSPRRMVEAYRPVVDDPGSYGDRVRNLATLLADMGHPSQASALRAFLVEYSRRIGDTRSLQADLSNHALILKLWGRLSEAMALHQEAEGLCRELGDRDGLRISLGSQAVILHAWGHLDEAMALHRQEEDICRELGNEDGLLVSLGNQASVLKSRGLLAEAMSLLEQVERLCRRLGNLDGLSVSLGNQALIFQAWRHWDEAMKRLKQQEQVCRELGNQDGLQISLGEQASTLYSCGHLEEAMALYKQKEQIAHRLGKKHSVSISLGNQAGILGTWGRPQEAMAQLKEQERICRELGNQEGLATCLANQATLLSEQMGQPHEARPLAEEAHRIATEHHLVTLAQQTRAVKDSVQAAVDLRAKQTSGKPMPPRSAGNE